MSSGKIRETWYNINQLINKKIDNKLHPIIINNEKLFDSKLIAQAFNDYFVNLFNKPSDINPVYKNYISFNNPQSFSLEPTDPYEIIKFANLLSNSRSSDSHCLSNWILKIIIHPLSDILAYLVNKVFFSAIFPDCLKIARIVPIHKNDSLNELSNYRPISLISCLSKLIEKIFKSKIELYLKNHNILNKNQYGFRKGFSTEDAVLHFVNEVVRNSDNGNHTLALFIDFSKAFDSVNHKLLILKLECYGIRGKPSELISSYLSNRFQYVSINGIL